MNIEYEEDHFPLKLYVYDSKGFYRAPVSIQNTNVLKTLMNSTVALAIMENREVRITDPGDSCVFHSENGVILWPEGFK